MWYKLCALVVISLCVIGQTAGARLKRQSGTILVCKTEECNKTADRVSSGIDKAIDPCEDFYGYACGGWMQNNPIPPSASYIDVLSKLREDVSTQVEELINQPITAGDIEAVQKLKTFYNSCMDEDEQNKRGKEPMEQIFKKIGPWPLMVKDWNEQEFDLVDLLLKLRQYDRKYVVSIAVGADLKNQTARIIRIDQPPLGMGRNKFVGSKSSIAIPAFKKYALDVAKALGVENEETLNSDVENLGNFAEQVAIATAPSSERRYVSQVYNKMTIKELYTNISDKFDWLRYIKGLMSSPEVGIDVDEDEPVLVLGTSYLKKIFDIIETTDNRTVANYVMWLMVKSTSIQLSYDFRLLSLNFSSTFSGRTELSSRSKKCKAMINHMGAIVGRLFIDTYFDNSSMVTMKTLIAELRKAFNSMLGEIDWMDDKTRKLAKEKAEAMDEKIGYSEEIRDDAKLNDQFKELKYDVTKYFENVLAGSAFVSTKYLRLLRTPVDPKGWTKDPTTVNAYYSGLRNQIMFPAGILQDPLFHDSYPKSMNYGGIGMLIGHEITHGFDDKGKQYDKDGNYVQWWSDEVKSNFEKAAQCIINQYGQYVVPEANMTMDGFKTHGENIADNGGLRQAYKFGQLRNCGYYAELYSIIEAYHTWLDEGNEDSVLPTLPFDRDQLFFLNFAQIWCQNLSPATAVSRIQKSVHSPARFRVIGTLRYFEPFSTAFNCDVSSNTNASETCRVW